MVDWFGFNFYQMNQDGSYFFNGSKLVNDFFYLIHYNPK